MCSKRERKRGRGGEKSGLLLAWGLGKRQMQEDHGKKRDPEKLTEIPKGQNNLVCKTM